VQMLASLYLPGRIPVNIALLLMIFYLFMTLRALA
jgi:hypothetical protein